VRGPGKVRVVTSQIRFSAFWSWAKTVVAPKSMAPTPTSVGRIPASSMRERRMASCTASAAAVPTRCSMAPTISPRTASSPRNTPTRVMITSRAGASEKRV